MNICQTREKDKNTQKQLNEEKTKIKKEYTRGNQKNNNINSYLDDINGRTFRDGGLYRVQGKPLRNMPK